MTDVRPLNILVVDDDDVDVMNIRRFFKRANISHPLFIASHGLQALQMLKSNVVPAQRRIVLLDINMPQMNGFEFLKELRADPELQQTSVVIFTTSNEERDRHQAYELNVAGYLLKPVAFSDFAETITTLNKYWSLMELP